jgi:hypothetical protein
MPRPPEDDKTLRRLPEDDETLRRLPEDDSTLAVTSESLVGHDLDPSSGELPADTVPVEAVRFPDLDAADEGQTQRVPFEPGDLGAPLDEMEQTVLGETQRAHPPRPAARPAPRPVAEAIPAPKLSSPVPLETRHGVGRTLEAAATPASLPPTSPSPPTLASPTPTPAASPSATTGPARRLAAAPAPAWFVGYLVTCAVLTMIGLGVLWFEYRTLGHLLPLWAPGR